MGLVLLALVLFAGCSSVPRVFSPVQPISPQDITHEAFDRLLQAHVRDGHVNYAAIRADGRLDEYLRQLDRSDPNGLPTRDARLVFWINAYNAFAIKGILDRYSPMTLWGRYRYFIARDYSVGGRTINLYNLERGLLISDFHEPRVHFAIVCASSSCPKLQSWAYDAVHLDQQLETVTKAFVNDPSRNRFDRERKIAYLSMIFRWFMEDFEAQAGSLLDYVRRYVTDQSLARELATTPYHVEFLEYDWSLNGTPPGKDEHASRP
jgi:hypothetical protein